jgi:hypothetical protein
VISGGATQVAPARTAPLFQFSTDDFWLNLHHYLYVLGRAHNRAPDATQPAVASAPDDERQGLAALTEEERRLWDEAVTAYANGLSRQTSFLQPPLAAMSIALTDGGDSDSFPAATFDSAVRATLERAAPLYRKAWWPRHRAMNQRYVRDLQQTIDGDGPAIVAFLTRAYQLEWPRRPYPTHLVAYSSWQGAFSITDSVLILSTNTNAANNRWYPLESVFHESLHQWDNDVAALLRTQAATRGVDVPQDLSHALIFFTSGEAVRRVHPEHVPMVDALNIWRLPLSGARLPAQRLKNALLEIWQPYLEGRGTRDEALGQLLTAAAAAAR